MKPSIRPLLALALLNAESALGGSLRSNGKRSNEAHSLTKRAECGVGIGSCNPGSCCSDSGHCGTTEDYCGGSQCQLEYSDSCDTFFGPTGESTENIPRPILGDVPYGTIITKCKNPRMMALTFDDGPYIYTTQMLDNLDSLGVKATFFIAGNNRGKGHIDDASKPWAAILRRMHEAGHQLASHTWTHRDLNAVNQSIQWSEMVYNEMAFRNIFGFFPTYMRPPYLECSVQSGCTDLMESLGYHIVTNNIDTKDYEFDDASLIQQSKNRFSNAVSSDAAHNGYITLAHDVHYQTVVNLTAYMVETSRDRGYQLVTVGECLGDPKANWYRDAPKKTGGSCSSRPSSTVAAPGTTTSTTSKATPSPTKAAGISPDQTCGGSKGYTCQGSRFGNCCSYYGFCGSSASYCGTGCDVDFGKCDPVPGGIPDTTNGLCGSGFGATCLHYGAKTCCSQYGYCGNAVSHCGSGCQTKYGTCT